MKKRSVFGACFLLFYSSSSAQEGSKTYKMPVRIVRGKGRLPSFVPKTGKDAITLSMADGVSGGSGFVPSILEREKGIHVTGSSVPGMLSQVSLRGAGAGHTAVIIDGIIANNPATIGAYDFSTLLTEDMKEAVIGPAGTFQNHTHAPGGTILMKTRRGEGKAGFQINGAMGSYPYKKLNIQGAGEQERSDFFISATHFESGKGERQTFHRNRVSDSFALDSLTTNIGYNFPFGLALRGIFQVQSSSLRDSILDADGLPRVSGNKTQSNKHRLLLDLVYGGSSALSHELIIAQTGTRQDFRSDITRHASGDTNILNYKGKWEASRNTCLFLDVENIQEKHKMPDVATRVRELRFLSMGYHIKALEKLLFQLSGRMHQVTGNKTCHTWQFDTRYMQSKDFTLKAGYGTGVTFARMDQVYGWLPYVLPAGSLKPETSKSVHAGFEWFVPNHGLLVDFSGFYTEISDLIVSHQIQQNVFRNSNLEKRRIKGLEIHAKWKLHKNVSMDTAYTLSSCHDSGENARTHRIPRHKLNTDILWHVQPEWDLYAGFVFRSSFRDWVYAFPNGRYVNLASYGTFHAGAVYRIAEDCQWYGRVDNILNREYENVYGYGAAGIQGSFGIKVCF